MRLGTGRAVITPPIGTMLAGYARDRAAAEALDDLELRAFWFERDGEAICLVTADIIGFSESQTRRIREEMAAQFGLSPEAILLAASHTHSGPQTCENLGEAGGLPVPEYMAELRRLLMNAVEEARGRLRPVRLRAGRGRLSGFAINRRVLVDGVAQMRPNPEGVRDDEVTVLACHDADSEEARAILFQYTCHPTTMGDHRITGDYPGAARRHVETAFPGAAAGFLPGCFGDVRPACTVIGGKTFRRGGPEDVAAFGAALGGEVARVAREATHPVRPRLFARAETLTLPLVKEPETAALSLQRMDLAENFTLITLGGEICVDYGHFIKALRPGDFVVPIGYSNGMTGYIASARLFPEGGYEPDTSYWAFDLPSPFQPAIEGIIQQAIRAQMRDA